jgi:hypothetical protein
VQPGPELEPQVLPELRQQAPLVLPEQVLVQPSLPQALALHLGKPHAVSLQPVGLRWKIHPLRTRRVLLVLPKPHWYQYQVL